MTTRNVRRVVGLSYVGFVVVLTRVIALAGPSSFAAGLALYLVIAALGALVAVVLCRRIARSNPPR